MKSQKLFQVQTGGEEKSCEESEVTLSSDRRRRIKAVKSQKLLQVWTGEGENKGCEELEVASSSDRRSRKRL
ncbi:hypothetical protein ACFYKX_13405 [Cytobacillus sp. FJAT-54145]|uniref:Uncharacterized protein n=1 Tax=Cytobacillus spartinae TaxID=3299023 RepID=A0ABW6KFD0_9BACI